jgi:hypothetical protein
MKAKPDEMSRKIRESTIGSRRVLERHTNRFRLSPTLSSAAAALSAGCANRSH